MANSQGKRTYVKKADKEKAQREAVEPKETALNEESEAQEKTWMVTTKDSEEGPIVVKAEEVKEEKEALEEAPEKIEKPEGNLMDLAQKVHAEKVQAIIEESAPKKQHQMFHQLEEDRINLEAKEAEKKAEAKRLAAIEEEKMKKTNANKSKLVCPFCSHVQYDIHSKDPTSAWCESCGRCYSAIWSF
jgi:protease II